MTQERKMIPIAKPTLDERETEAASKVILSGWLTQGPQVAAFEKEFAEVVGAPYACAVSNCTTALHLALLAVGVGQGDEVITVSHSFIATASVIRYCGATPVFVDIEQGGFNIDVQLIERAITPKTKAILCVHQLGMPCDLRKIVEIGKVHKIPVVEDAACAIGSEIQWGVEWHKIGKPHGDIACFSFHPRKILTTGDGGMITTGSKELDAKVRLWRQHSMNVPDTVRHGSAQVIFENYPEVGFNYRMTDVQAAIGREQLKRLPEILEHRRRIARAYAQRLRNIPGLGIPSEPAWARTNWQSYCVKLPAGADQRAVMQSMLDNGVSTRRGVMCAHREPSYPAGTYRAASHLSRSEAAQENCIILPLYGQMTEAEVNTVAEALEYALANAKPAALSA
ncbi:DegT/DnrJ/EryC1/StrS family aminotransferase [Mesorhizobium sp. GR13]|uniref:DegT/DnrJ/EryC1/StrS family aminotransferase n=1 Tax=Mesorhizobium sp. GR13 TaxID=2562308 RepID=UPI0010C0AD83|nr:DegT/DnrJ/EryC1/StrS family aminotransferase [Mesorhizobium sp. GR13]